MKLEISDEQYGGLVNISKRLHQTAIGPVLYVPYKMIIKIFDKWVGYVYDDVQGILADMELEGLPVEGREWFAEGRGWELNGWFTERNIPYERKVIPTHYPLNRVSLFHDEVCRNELEKCYAPDEGTEHTCMDLLWEFIWDISMKDGADEED